MPLGVINRGDSFRRRRSRSNSLAPTSPMQEKKMVPTATGPVDSYLVMMLGAAGVGKAALTSQFRTSECINAYEGPGEERDEEFIIWILFIFVGNKTRLK